MTDIANNPLAKHFRQPSLYIKLTSEGKYWKDGALDLPATGEIPVYPMTAKDEITLRTPDSLLSGSSVVQVLESCCPNIKDAWEMPSVDVDSTLISVRIASYGDTMTVTAVCPQCSEEHDYDISLQDVLAKIHMPDYSQTVTTDDGLTIKFRPLTYREISSASTIEFTEEKLIQSLTDTSVDEALRKIEFGKHIAKMIELNNENISNCTRSIVADGVDITDKNFIKEYYANANAAVSRKVKQKVQEFTDVANIQPVNTLCTSCNKEFKLSIDFDYSRFFVSGF